MCKNMDVGMGRAYMSPARDALLSYVSVLFPENRVIFALYGVGDNISLPVGF